ncbi:50S ribosomal protein L31 [candidate division MSBL1 archaeon SCGC-AAA382N08]|uniref:Large ribosomal subunit protein bL31 n=1 Tax=candidate division MSBL1 archaeon SCGC-AAA382N08 TaxID=1698285 RepID=A0A133VQX4_9EURY|nr:50S ribosomal protein L31 [candidate division MSBL1 archaeon SCGC-AAA382N08]
MKQDIHPQYHKNAQVQCACGNEFTVGSTKKLIEVEICSECHPFYTGQEKVVDKQGQIQKFKEKYGEE